MILKIHRSFEIIESTEKKENNEKGWRKPSRIYDVIKRINIHIIVNLRRRDKKEQKAYLKNND